MALEEVVVPHNPHNGWDREPASAYIHHRVRRRALDKVLDRDERLMRHLRGLLSRKTLGSDKRVYERAKRVRRLLDRVQKNYEEFLGSDFPRNSERGRRSGTRRPRRSFDSTTRQKDHRCQILSQILKDNAFRCDLPRPASLQATGCADFRRGPEPRTLRIAVVAVVGIGAIVIAMAPSSLVRNV